MGRIRRIRTSNLDWRLWWLEECGGVRDCWWGIGGCPEGMGLCSRVHGAVEATCARLQWWGRVSERHLVECTIWWGYLCLAVRDVTECATRCLVRHPSVRHYNRAHKPVGIVYPATQPHALRALFAGTPCGWGVCGYECGASLHVGGAGEMRRASRPRVGRNARVVLY